MKKLSEHISYLEATRSATALRLGIDNTPDDRQITVMRHLAINVFEPLRNHFKTPIRVSSFYRSPILNRKIGGASKSDHMVQGDVAAIDLDNDPFENWTGVSNADIFWYIYDNLDYYKLIWEFGDNEKPSWVHISFSLDDQKNKRKHTYHAHKPKGRTVYSLFDESKFKRSGKHIK